MVKKNSRDNPLLDFVAVKSNWYSFSRHKKSTPWASEKEWSWRPERLRSGRSKPLFNACSCRGVESQRDRSRMLACAHFVRARQFFSVSKNCGGYRMCRQRENDALKRHLKCCRSSYRSHDRNPHKIKLRLPILKHLLKYKGCQISLLCDGAPTTVYHLWCITQKENCKLPKRK